MRNGQIKFNASVLGFGNMKILLYILECHCYCEENRALKLHTQNKKKQRNFHKAIHLIKEQTIKNKVAYILPHLCLF